MNRTVAAATLALALVVSAPATALAAQAAEPDVHPAVAYALAAEPGG